MTAARIAVAGGAGDIGAAAVQQLVSAGHRVVIIDREVPDAGGESVVADLQEPRACTQAIRQAVGKLGGLDGLVHAAGIVRDGVIWKLGPADWSAVLATNLDSAFHLCRAAIPHLRAAGGGAIVLVSSINGERGKFGQSAYAASKAGMHGLAKSMARETGRFGIRVNVVAPGMIDTALTASLPDEIRAAAVAESCLGRLGQPADVAAVISFLLSAAARHVTGQVVRVDGGQYL